MGNWILLNLFLAILLKNFEEKEQVDTTEKIVKASMIMRFKSHITLKLRKYCCCCCKMKQSEIDLEDLGEESSHPSFKIGTPA
jgi:ABC-type polysaccharide/polyol phosphate transport system ATPase subunit